MRTGSKQKLKYVIILEILRQETDADHPMQTNTLLKKLEEQGIECSRETLYSDIKALNENGFEIFCNRSSSNEYYIEDRGFDVPEIRILIDAVNAASFITPKKTVELVGKVAALGGSHRGEIMKSETKIYNTTKHSNEYIYYNINEIELAITLKKKVSFYYFDYNEKKEKVFRKDKKRYYINPYAMLISNDNYYLIGYNDFYKNFLHFRIDRMTETRISHYDIVESEEIDEFDLAKHYRQLFGMYSSPKFDFYYDRIKALLTMKECQIIGFSLSNDTGFLATACELFGKEPIPFTYYDFQKLYQGYTKAKNRTSVEGVVKELEIIGIHLHKSDDDAYAVIRALQIIGEREKLTLPETLEMLKQKNKSYKAERAREHNLSLIEKINSGNSKAQSEFLKNFIHRLKVSEEKKEAIFFGKIVCISSHFQAKRFNEFLAIIKRVYEYGATYTGKVSMCDIFIEYQDGEEEDVRMAIVKKVVENGEKEITILSLAEALKLLGLAEKDLNKVDYINCKLYTERKTRKYQKGQTYIDKNEKPTTIGDVLRLQGVDISKFLSED